MFWYDIFILAIIGAGFLYGLLKGIISELFAFAGLVGGFIVALKYSFYLQPYILPLVKKEPISLIIGFIILFLVTAAAVVTIGIFFKKAIKYIHLSWLDRIIGGIFGVIKGLIVAGLISLVIYTFFPGGKSFMKKSTLGRRSVIIVKIAIHLLPEKYRVKEI
jgi:membrane protein required for colicin V production